MEKQQNVVCNEMKEKVVENGGSVSAEDTFVDELIDFSKAEEYGFYSKSEEVMVPFHLESINATNVDSPQFPLPLQESDLCLPAYERANLEWLSNFVDDFNPAYTLTMRVDNIGVKPEPKPEPKPSLKENCSATFSVQTKARSKRVRKGARGWSLNDSTSSSSSSSSCTPPSQLALDNYVSHSAADKQSVKKQKQKQKQDGGEPRRCSHCLVQKTPQWRAGPMGAKTLCNACGVRYKSGRLLPEYRPAISPTFSSEKHSNNHRKVMEMRKKKGDAGFVMPVKSF
ncbi:GATA transcription factor [Heracleum sosnowskyi]|uniref:GATA transcription factor n=1 Tax=Heracleum sosnowskyi TaxID=360622 RepID=A0AAD8HW02_9APIA|nr:GATA transcription factor [Heracleum sosnowskyi]